MSVAKDAPNSAPGGVSAGFGPSLQQPAGYLGGRRLGEVLGVAEPEPAFPAGAVIPFDAGVSPGELPWQARIGDAFDQFHHRQGSHQLPPAVRS